MSDRRAERPPNYLLNPLLVREPTCWKTLQNGT